MFLADSLSTGIRDGGKKAHFWISSGHVWCNGSARGMTAFEKNRTTADTVMSDIVWKPEQRATVHLSFNQTLHHTEVLWEIICAKFMNRVHTVNISISDFQNQKRDLHRIFFFLPLFLVHVFAWRRYTSLYTEYFLLNLIHCPELTRTVKNGSWLRPCLN